MSNLVNYGTTPTVQVLDPAPTGAGGLAIQNDIKAIVDYGATLAASIVTKADATALTAHTSNTSNPHGTTAAQVGAYTTAQTDTLLDAKADATHNHDVTDLSSPDGTNGLLTSTGDGTVDVLPFASLPVAQSQVTNLTTDLAAKADATALTAHTSNTSNPHAVTYAQVGAAAASHTHAQSDVTNLVTDLASKATTSALTAHTSNTSNPHGVTYTQVGAAAASHTHAQVDVTNLVSDLAAKASTSALTAHTGNTSNPHSVTAAQVGAYTTAQTDTLLSAKANTVHAHSIAQVTGLQTALNGKANTYDGISGHLTYWNAGGLADSGILADDVVGALSLANNALNRNNNLTDLTDPAQAQIALGLGTMATQNASDVQVSSLTLTTDDDMGTGGFALNGSTGGPLVTIDAYGNTVFNRDVWFNSGVDFEAPAYFQTDINAQTIYSNGYVYTYGLQPPVGLGMNYVTVAGNLRVQPASNTTLSGTTTALSIATPYAQSGGTTSNTDLFINSVGTRGSGTQLLIDAQVSGVSKFRVRTDGQIDCGYVSGTVGNFSTGIYATYVNQPSNATMNFQNGATFNSTTGIQFFNGTSFTGSSGGTGLYLSPTINVTGVTGVTDLRINRTETSLGVGTHFFLDCQVAGASKFSVTNTGTVSISGSATIFGAMGCSSVTAGSYNSTGTTTGVVIGNSNKSSSGVSTAVSLAAATFSHSAAASTFAAVNVSPTISMTSGVTSGWTALRVNATQTSDNSTGTKRLFDAQLGGTSKASIDTSGNLRIAGNLGVGNWTAATTLGTVNGKVEIFDANGNSKGFLPTYASIT